MAISYWSDVHAIARISDYLGSIPAIISAIAPPKYVALWPWENLEPTKIRIMDPLAETPAGTDTGIERLCPTEDMLFAIRTFMPEMTVYRLHPVLRFFPVPNALLNEAEFTLRVAFREDTTESDTIACVLSTKGTAITLRKKYALEGLL